MSARVWPRKRIKQPAQRRDLRLAAPELGHACALVDVDEQHRLHPLEIALPAEQAAQHHERDVEPRLQTDRVADRAEAVEAEQRLRAQQSDAERPVRDEARRRSRRTPASVGRTSV